MATTTKSAKSAKSAKPTTRARTPKQPDRRGPLRCHRHGITLTPDERGRALTVERDTQRITRKGKKRIAVNVTCPRGCDFLSVHPAAVTESRRLDREAKAQPADTAVDA